MRSIRSWLGGTAAAVVIVGASAGTAQATDYRSTTLLSTQAVTPFSTTVHNPCTDEMVYVEGDLVEKASISLVNGGTLTKVESFTKDVRGTALVTRAYYKMYQLQSDTQFVSFDPFGPTSQKVEHKFLLVRFKDGKWVPEDDFYMRMTVYYSTGGDAKPMRQGETYKAECF